MALHSGDGYIYTPVLSHAHLVSRNLAQNLKRRPLDALQTRENLRFCRAIKFAACRMSSDFSSAGEKHVAGTSQFRTGSNSVLINQRRNEINRLKESQTKLLNPSIRMSSFLSFAFIAQISNSRMINSRSRNLNPSTNRTPFYLSGNSEVEATAS